MEWLWGLALLPALLCGLMCVGGIVFAALGLRQATPRRGCRGDDVATTAERPDEVTAGR